MLKGIARSLGVSIHGPIPPNRYWGYYTGPELAALAQDPNATAIMNVGGIAQCGPHLPCSTNTLTGEEVLGAALSRLSADTLVLALPPTNYGKSIEHAEYPGTITYRGETLRMVLMDVALSVARTGFCKLVLFGSHGGDVGLMDDFFRDLHIDSGLRVYKIHMGLIANTPGLASPAESAVSLHGGDGGTSLVQHLAPELVDMSRAAGYVYEPNPNIGFSFKGQDAIEAWTTADLAPNGVIGNPLTARPDKGAVIFEAKVARLAQLLEAIYRDPRRLPLPAVGQFA